MKVTVATRGGQAGAFASRLPPKILDAGTLAPAAAAELTRLIEAARQAPAAPLRAGAVPGDSATTTITVEAEGPPLVLRQSDAGMTPAFAALVDWLARRSSER
jgi:hypothetical protein